MRMGNTLMLHRKQIPCGYREREGERAREKKRLGGCIDPLDTHQHARATIALVGANTTPSRWEEATVEEDTKQKGEENKCGKGTHKYYIM